MIENTGELIVSTINLYEVHKKILLEKEEDADFKDLREVKYFKKD